MRGLSHDRGLFVPDSFPTVTKEEVESWRSLPYAELATNVIGKFVKDDQVPREKLADIITRSCDAFRSDDVTPVVDVGGHMILVSNFRSDMYAKRCNDAVMSTQWNLATKGFSRSLAVLADACSS
jgi:threonine synthase